MQIDWRIVGLVIGAWVSGCSSGTLAGDWEGEITCPGGSAAGLELDLDEADDGSTDGSGVTWFNDMYGYYWQISFEAVVLHDRLSEGAELEIELDDCFEFELGDMDCPRLDTARYVDESTVEGEVDTFFGLTDCEFELELD